MAEDKVSADGARGEWKKEMETRVRSVDRVEIQVVPHAMRGIVGRWRSESEAVACRPRAMPVSYLVDIDDVRASAFEP